MKADYWKSRWREGRIGFHEGVPNALLQKHGSIWSSPQRLLIPLCGKSADISWLVEQGHEVVGVDLSELAVQAYFTERGRTPSSSEREGFLILQEEKLSLYAGDFFQTTAELLGGPFTAFYDRAALIALPPDLRKRYVAHLKSLLAPRAQGLLITMEYEQSAMEGPPFSVPSAEVEEHWGPTSRLLEDREGDGPRLREAQIPAREKCYQLLPVDF